MKTDVSIQQDVLAELKWAPAVNAAEIGVEVKDGIVTLAGRDSWSERELASQSAWASPGVINVVDNIAIVS